MGYIRGVIAGVFVFIILIVGYNQSQNQNNTMEYSIDGKVLKTLIYLYPMISNHFKYDLFTGEGLSAVDQREIDDFDIIVSHRLHAADLIYLDQLNKGKSMNFQISISITDGVIYHGELSKLNLDDVSIYNLK